MAETTVLFYTDNSFEGRLASIVRLYIEKATDLPIISVSQEPFGFGNKNICIGKIGRSFLSLYRQILIGAQAIKTPYVALAEHDTLYPKGHFDWIPPKRDVFYYANNTVWVVAKKGPQYGQFMTHYSQNPSMESMICSTDILVPAMERRVALLESGDKKPPGWGEPGYAYDDEKYEMHSLDVPIIDIKHDDNFTMREGFMKAVFWELEGWGHFSDIC